MKYFYFLLVIFFTACTNSTKKTNQSAFAKHSTNSGTLTQTTSTLFTTDSLPMNTNHNESSDDKTVLTKECQNETDALRIQGVRSICLPHITQPIHSLRTAIQKGDTIKIACFGNSITNGYKVGSFGTVDAPYPYVLEKLIKKKVPHSSLEIIKEGHNGWRIDQAAKNLDALIIAKKPDWVTLMFGINDAYAGWSVSFYRQQMKQILQKLKAQNIKVILFTPTPFLTSYNKTAITYLPVLKELAQKYQCAFFNLHRAILQRIQKDKLDLDKVFPDEVHFGDDYYALIAEEIFDIIYSSK